MGVRCPLAANTVAGVKPGWARAALASGFPVEACLARMTKVSVTTNLSKVDVLIAGGLGGVPWCASSTSSSKPQIGVRVWTPREEGVLAASARRATRRGGKGPQGGIFFHAVIRFREEGVPGAPVRPGAGRRRAGAAFSMLPIASVEVVIREALYWPQPFRRRGAWGAGQFKSQEVGVVGRNAPRQGKARGEGTRRPGKQQPWAATLCRPLHVSILCPR